MNDWPASNDYTIAIQSPRLCFRDPDLSGATVERTAHTRMPKVWTGNFAQVYAMRHTERWAVKCFTRSALDLRARYKKIAAAIARSRLRCFVEFKFLDAEMLVNGTRYPVVKMEWIEGQPLDEFVVANLNRPGALLETAAGLRDLVADLERKRLAHGDLQHGNILVTAAGIRLLDYDGLFVPAFDGTRSPETGVPSYQHPRRTPSDYGVGLDRFSLLVICTGLSALASDPGLWNEFNTGDNLLFTADDFKRPESSALFRRIGGLPDPQVRSCIRALTAACAQRVMAVPLFDAPMSLTAGPRHAFWWVTKEPRGDEGAQAPARGRLVSFRPGAAAALLVGGVAIAAATARLGGVAGLILALLLVSGYLRLVITRFNALPARRRRLELSATITRLEYTLAGQRASVRRGPPLATIRVKKRGAAEPTEASAQPGTVSPLVGIRLRPLRTRRHRTIDGAIPDGLSPSTSMQCAAELDAARREFEALRDATLRRYLTDALLPPSIEWWPRLLRRRGRQSG